MFKKHLKKVIIFLIICTFITTCHYFLTKKIHNVQIELVKSSVFSEKELQKAVKIIKNEHLALPAKLQKIYYEEKSYSKPDPNTMILYSEFHTYKDTDNSGFNRDNDYTYHWIFKKNSHDKWILTGAGQG